MIATNPEQSLLTYRIFDSATYTSAAKQISRTSETLSLLCYKHWKLLSEMWLKAAGRVGQLQECIYLDEAVMVSEALYL